MGGMNGEESTQEIQNGASASNSPLPRSENAHKYMEERERRKGGKVSPKIRYAERFPSATINE